MVIFAPGSLTPAREGEETVPKDATKTYNGLFIHLGCANGKGVFAVTENHSVVNYAVFHQRRRVNMFRRDRLNLTLIAALLALVMAVAFYVPAMASDPTTITILHVNDVHGRMDAFKSGNVDLGALSKVAAYVAELRKNPDANIMLLSAGDMIHGTNVVNLFGGLPMIEVMNIMGFDAMALGNHEFNYGQEQLLALEEKAQFPFLAANVIYPLTLRSMAGDWVVKEVAGVKVGIFGLSPLETPIVTHPNNVIGLEFVDPVAIAKKQVEILSQEADIVICLSHLGYSADKELAAAVPGIDIIVGGHSHTLLKAPERVEDTIIVQAGEWAANLGKLDVIVDGDRIVAYDGNLIPITADMPASAPSSAVGEVLDKYSKALSDKMSVVVGSTPVALVGERADVRTRTTNLSNLVTDAMREATSADIVITNGGGIRASLPAGNITMNGVYSVLPFDNSLVVIELTGEGVLKALEHGLRLYPAQNGAFAQVSGLTLKFDPAKEAGSRIIEVLVGDKPLDPAKKYIVATNDFMAAGGDGYEWFKNANVLFSSGDMLRDVFASYVEAHGVVPVSDEARIQIVK